MTECTAHSRIGDERIVDKTTVSLPAHKSIRRKSHACYAFLAPGLAGRVHCPRADRLWRARRRWLAAAVAARRDLPITPGLMPVTNIKQIARMAQLMGTELPSAVVDRLVAVDGDPRAVQEVGVTIATELAARMLAEGAPGIHFITMNHSLATLEVLANLGLPASS